MKHPEYSVWTLADIAKIPDEALPRLFADLPLILEVIRQLELVAPGCFDEDAAPVEKPVWIDDGSVSTTLVVDVS